MLRLITTVAVFVASLIGTTIACTIFWEVFVHAKLYDCTDPGFLDYITPGDWVHGDGQHHSIVFVDHVVHGRSMSEPDTIKRGWSVPGLWCLWVSFVVASLLFSAALAVSYGSCLRKAARIRGSTG